ncbi:TadE/TadG family type IV pilus assembly protein [Rhodovulum sp. YNF3179]|uniref:TadE/TadG family type IV pilus assembly protein n=1 Tax=Rhodovulum sp. YNF3179 TaxID=3425127 RepID=UPI003D32EF28
MRLRFRHFSWFRRSQRGSVLVETIVVLPVITIFSIGLLEFGTILWQRHQIQTGVRDAARYLSRCTYDAATCSKIAKNIAFYADPLGTAATPTPGERVPGWNGSPASEFQVTPATPAIGDVITVYAQTAYRGSPLFSALGLEETIELEYYHQTQVFGF